MKALVGIWACAVGGVATWFLISVYKASSRPGAEGFGFEFVFMPCFLAAAVCCFGIAWLCFYRPDGLPSQFSVRTMFIITTLIAGTMGLAAWLGS